MWKEYECSRIPLEKENIYLSPLYANLTFKVDGIYTKLYNDEIIVCGNVGFNLPEDSVKYFLEKEGWVKDEKKK